ncbi:MAG: ABC transporter substrate-binding protein, partial [Alphaproteobacteria bacterium]
MKKILFTAASLMASSAFADISVLVEGGGLQLQKTMAEQFTAETGIKVNFVEVPYQGVYDKLASEIASGSSAYDVATIDVAWNAAFAKHVEDLSDLFTDEVKADLPPALLADVQVDGKYMGMPTWANVEIVLYRKDLWDDEANKEAFKAEYGYELQPPKTWQQWRDMAKFFTKDGMYGTSINGMNSEELMAHVLQAGSPAIMNDNNGEIIVNHA